MNQIGNPTSGLLGAAATAGRRLHPWPVRVMHWINAVVMLVMITSGWGIYDDDVIIRGFHFSQFWRLGDWAAWSLNWHFAGMWFLVINGLFYLIYGFASGRLARKAAADPAGRTGADGRRHAALQDRARGHHRLQCSAEAALHRRHPCRHLPGRHRSRHLEAGPVLRPGLAAWWLPDRAGAAFRRDGGDRRLPGRARGAGAARSEDIVGDGVRRPARRCNASSAPSKVTRHEIAVPAGYRGGCRDPGRP